MGAKRKAPVKEKEEAKEPMANKKAKPTSSLAAKIEHCKSWGIFKKHAAIVEKLLKEAGYESVEINAEKPRKGAFVVSSGEDNIIELLGMPRPFKKLRELDIEATITDYLASKE